MSQTTVPPRGRRSWRLALTAAVVPTMMSATIFAGAMPASALPGDPNVGRDFNGTWLGSYEGDSPDEFEFSIESEKPVSASNGAVTPLEDPSVAYLLTQYAEEGSVPDEATHSALAYIVFDRLDPTWSQDINDTEVFGPEWDDVRERVSDLLAEAADRAGNYGANLDIDIDYNANLGTVSNVALSDINSPANAGYTARLVLSDNAVWVDSNSSVLEVPLTDEPLSYEFRVVDLTGTVGASMTVAGLPADVVSRTEADEVEFARTVEANPRVDFTTVTANIPATNKFQPRAFFTPNNTRPVVGENDSVNTTLTTFLAEGSLPWEGSVDVVSTLYGPFEGRPQTSFEPGQFTPVVGSVTTAFTEPGTVETDELSISAPGYYVWMNSIAGDENNTAFNDQFFGQSVTPDGETIDTTLLSQYQTVLTATSADLATTGSDVETVLSVSDAGPESVLDVESVVTGPYPTQGDALNPAFPSQPIVDTVTSEVTIGASGAGSDGRGSARAEGITVGEEAGFYRITHTADNAEGFEQNASAEFVDVVEAEAVVVPPVDPDPVDPDPVDPDPTDPDPVDPDPVDPVDPPVTVPTPVDPPVVVTPPVVVVPPVDDNNGDPQDDLPEELPVITYTCDEFDSQENAQNIFDLDRVEFAYLDADGDGLACESNSDLSGPESTDGGIVPVVSDSGSGDNTNRDERSERQDRSGTTGRSGDTDLNYQAPASQENNIAGASLAGLGLLAAGGVLMRRMRRTSA